MNKDKIELKDILHLYIGAECRYINQLSQIETRTITGINLNEQTVSLTHGIGTGLQVVNRVKIDSGSFTLLLTPLSEMTEEDAKWLFENNNFNGVIAGDTFGSFRITHPDRMEVISTQETGYRIWFDSLSPQQVAYLLKQGYDVLSGIDSGWAVNKKKG